MRRDLESWIKLRKNAGMVLVDRMKEMEFAKQIFKAWDTRHRGYLTAKEFSEQLCGLGLSTSINFTQRLLFTLCDVAVKDGQVA